MKCIVLLCQHWNQSGFTESVPSTPVTSLGGLIPESDAFYRVFALQSLVVGASVCLVCRVPAGVHVDRSRSLALSLSLSLSLLLSSGLKLHTIPALFLATCVFKVDLSPDDRESSFRAPD